MKVHSIKFKEQISKMGRELDSKITCVLDGEVTVLSGEQLIAVTPSFQSSILKSVMKQLDIQSKVEIPIGTNLQYELGVKVRENEVEDYRENYDYVDFGNYIVHKVEKQEDTESYNVICYDKMLLSMVPYYDSGIQYPLSIRDYIQAVCDAIGIVFADKEKEFANYDKVVENELFLNEEGGNLGFTFRDVFDQLAQVTASTICLNLNDELEIRYINDTNDTIDDNFLKDINVKFGEKFGPVNSIVLSRAGQSDNIYLDIPESVEINGRKEIKISENQFMNFNNRNEFLPDILEKLAGLEYYTNDFTSTGICYYDVCDRYNVEVNGIAYPCIMFNNEILVTQGLEELIYTDMPEETQTDYNKSDKTDVKLNQVYIIVNKQTGEIEAMAKKVTEVSDGLGNVYTKEQANQLIANAETGVTNTFSEAGGNNILKNTNFSAKEVLEEGQKYEYWFGNVEKKSNANAVNDTAIILQEGSLYQEQKVSNGQYTLSFYYKKANPLANVSLKVNDKEYELTELDDFKLFQTGLKDDEGVYITESIIVTNNALKVEFITDINNSCEIYDIMCNVGSIKLAYSQNANETTTDTVNISKGITIISSETDVKFVANSRGIYTMPKNAEGTEEDISTKFTDEGLKTKSAVVENEAEIVGIRRQRVGNQIWDFMI